MHAENSERHHHLTATLADYLGQHGVTIAYDPGHPLDGDARWDARSRTFTLRGDAHPRRHLELIRDLVDMVTYGSPSRLGANHPRHLSPVPDLPTANPPRPYRHGRPA